MKLSEEYLTGIKRIDDHHKALFEMSEVFRDALIEGRGGRVYGLFLESLRGYACAHFGFEEGCMEQRQCSAAQQNNQAHSEFLQGLSVFEERYTMVGFGRADAQRLVDFVDEWGADHICCLDTKLKPHAQGL